MHLWFHLLKMLLLLDDQSNSFSISISMDWLSKKQEWRCGLPTVTRWMIDQSLVFWTDRLSCHLQFFVSLRSLTWDLSSFISLAVPWRSTPDSRTNRLEGSSSSIKLGFQKCNDRKEMSEMDWWSFGCQTTFLLSINNPFSLSLIYSFFLLTISFLWIGAQFFIDQGFNR